jgi:thiol-disulfide isomerase/thioredoxin
MKHALWFIFLAIMTCNAGEKSVNTYDNSAKTMQDMLVGAINRSDLQSEPFRVWFDANYSNYEVDEKTMDAIPPAAWEGIEITVVLATWCPDSRRELPGFLKILDNTGFPDENIHLISVNREKKVPSMDLEYLDFQLVPTMIFFRDGAEIGRIIESPEETLELDIAKIMTN